MSSPMLRLAIGLVRLWCRVYTWDMSPRLAASRCAEIESDLWDWQHDPDQDEGSSAAASRIIGRLLMGVPDDVAWRMECAADGDDPLLRKTIALTGAATVLVVALWTLPAWLGKTGSARRTAVTACADEASTARTTPDLRIRIMQCAGVFFTPQAKSPSPPLQGGP